MGTRLARCTNSIHLPAPDQGVLKMVVGSCDRLAGPDRKLVNHAHSNPLPHVVVGTGVICGYVVAVLRPRPPRDVAADGRGRRLRIHRLGPCVSGQDRKVCSAMLQLHIHRVVVRVAVPALVNEKPEILVRHALHDRCLAAVARGLNQNALDRLIGIGSDIQMSPFIACVVDVEDRIFQDSSRAELLKDQSPM